MPSTYKLRIHFRKRHDTLKPVCETRFQGRELILTSDVNKVTCGKCARNAYLQMKLQGFAARKEPQNEADSWWFT